MTPARWSIAAIPVVLVAVGAGLYLQRYREPSVSATRPSPQRVAGLPTPAKAPQPIAKASPAPSPYVIRRVLDIEGPMKIGDHVWDETGVPPGEVVITVDLEAQVLSIFRGGYEIGAAAILYGADAKPTPLGIYPITQKDADHVSDLYDAPMPYMLRLTNDGVAIHASEVADGYMTHGCIGVPLPFAKRLFAATHLGDRVIITRGERLALGKPVNAI